MIQDSALVSLLLSSCGEDVEQPNSQVPALDISFEFQVDNGALNVNIPDYYVLYDEGLNPVNLQSTQTKSLSFNDQISNPSISKLYLDASTGRYSLILYHDVPVSGNFVANFEAPTFWDRAAGDKLDLAGLEYRELSVSALAYYDSHQYFLDIYRVYPGTNSKTFWAPDVFPFIPMILEMDENAWATKTFRDLEKGVLISRTIANTDLNTIESYNRIGLPTPLSGEETTFTINCSGYLTDAPKDFAISLLSNHEFQPMDQSLYIPDFSSEYEDIVQSVNYRDNSQSVERIYENRFLAKDFEQFHMIEPPNVENDELVNLSITISGNADYCILRFHCENGIVTVYTSNKEIMNAQNLQSLFKTFDMELSGENGEEFDITGEDEFKSAVLLTSSIFSNVVFPNNFSPVVNRLINIQLEEYSTVYSIHNEPTTRNGKRDSEDLQFLMY